MRQQYFFVDTAALGRAASGCDAAAALIGHAVPTLLAFDGSRAGRAYAAEGDELRCALDRWGPELVGWSRATAQIAAALRAAIHRYGEAERSAADRVG